MRCRVWSRPPRTRQLNLKIGFSEVEALRGFQWTRREPVVQLTGRSALLIIGLQYAHYEGCHHSTDPRFVSLSISRSAYDFSTDASAVVIES